MLLVIHENSTYHLLSQLSLSEADLDVLVCLLRGVGHFCFKDSLHTESFYCPSCFLKWFMSFMPIHMQLHILETLENLKSLTGHVTSDTASAANLIKCKKSFNHYFLSPYTDPKSSPPYQHLLHLLHDSTAGGGLDQQIKIGQKFSIVIGSSSCSTTKLLTVHFDAFISEYVSEQPWIHSAANIMSYIIISNITVPVPKAEKDLKLWLYFTYELQWIRSRADPSIPHSLVLSITLLMFYLGLSQAFRS